jgi:hypothetical protein
MKTQIIYVQFSRLSNSIKEYIKSLHIEPKFKYSSFKPYWPSIKKLLIIKLEIG